MGRRRGNRSGWVEEEYPNICSIEATRPQEPALMMRYETVTKKNEKTLARSRKSNLMFPPRLTKVGKESK